MGWRAGQATENHGPPWICPGTGRLGGGLTVRVVVYSHRLEVGGSQTNAADLAASVRDLGHDVVVFGVDGPAAELVRSRGLRLVLAPDGQRHPAPRSVWALCQLARNEQADIVHAY